MLKMTPTVEQRQRLQGIFLYSYKILIIKSIQNIYHTLAVFYHKLMRHQKYNNIRISVPLPYRANYL